MIEIPLAIVLKILAQLIIFFGIWIGGGIFGIIVNFGNDDAIKPSFVLSAIVAVFTILVLNGVIIFN